MSAIHRAAGVRPMVHPSLRPRLVVAVAGWVVAAVALPVSVAAGGTASFATELVFLAAYVTALVLTVQLVRSRVAITVTAGEVRVGELRLPRQNLTVTNEPETLVLRVAGHEPVRLAAARRLMPWPGSGRGAQALVPRAMLARLAAELAGSPPADEAFGLLRTGRGRWRDVSPLVAAAMVIAAVNVVLSRYGRPALTVAALLDVAAFSAAVLLVAVRAWPRPVLRLLVMAGVDVDVVDVHTGRLVERHARTAVTAQRRRWRSPPSRMTPAVIRQGVRVEFGRVVLDVGFPEPAGGTDAAPMMPMPHWMTGPGEGDRLVRALTRR